MRSHAARATVVAGLAITVLAVATAAFAAKPGPGTSNGSATVFAPNPVAFLQDQSLTDQKDADYAALAPAYRTVVLTNLDGSGFLRGDYANIRSETGDPAYSPTNQFHYRRNDDRFEQVMAYYWVTEAQKYIQSLGFGSTLRPVNRESQDLRINQWGADNSFSWDKKDMIKLGKGGVDDAEDAEVILHELGHAIQDSQQDPFGYGLGFEARAIGEGFADYWAVTVADVLAPTPDPACVADWDAVSYTSTTPHCLRRVDLNLHYPENVNPNSVHSTGRIWSRALWGIRNELGHVKADTIILEGHFGQRDPTMRQLAESTVAAAQRLYGNSEANTVRAQFQARGIL
ncbi:MAG TPA: M36 family metallopeptidase [Gaiellaceae bacterium]|nr:M36 family metallopeptidase [Gaiellaceae bacterium]